MTPTFTPTSWRLAYETFVSQASFPTIAPTTTRPTGFNVVAPVKKRIVLAIAGNYFGGLSPDAQARVVGWRRLGDVYYPELIGVADAGNIDSNGVQGDGVALNSSLYVAFGVSLVYGNVAEDWQATSVGGVSKYEIGTTIFTHNGPELVQIDTRQTGHTDKTNALYCFI